MSGFRLTSCVWELTLACCFGCRYCGSAGGRARADELSTAECMDAAEQLADLEATMRGASRFRWKNPIGVYPLEADTVTLLGANGESVILVGSQGRFAVDGYPLHDGETLLAEVQNILAS